MPRPAALTICRPPGSRTLPSAGRVGALVAPLVTAFVTALVTALAAPVAGAAPQAVSVPSLAAASSPALELPATWFPADVSAPAPALVLLHGCGGVHDGRGQLAARYTALAAWLNARGVHALVTDSFTPRGERSICMQRNGARHITQLERRRDALGALAWLAAQPGVDASRIGLLGWSNGGSTVLAATNLRHAEVAAAAQRALRPSLAVAFYPGCQSELDRGYAPSAPLLMLLGEADDWTPAEPCKVLAAAAQTVADGAAVPAPQFEAYAGAYHGFDGAAPVRHWAAIPNGTRPGAGVHLGGDPAARAAAAERLDDFLRRRWSLPALTQNMP